MNCSTLFCILQYICTIHIPMYRFCSYLCIHMHRCHIRIYRYIYIHMYRYFYMHMYRYVVYINIGIPNPFITSLDHKVLSRQHTTLYVIYVRMCISNPFTTSLDYTTYFRDSITTLLLLHYLTTTLLQHWYYFDTTLLNYNMLSGLNYKNAFR
jgi:hypothetical protein